MPTFAQEVTADGPILWLRFGESTGTVAADSAGTNTGTYGAGVTLGQPGLVGDANTAALFDGIAGGVTVPDAAALRLGSAYSFEVPVRPTTLYTTRSQDILVKDKAYKLYVLLNGAVKATRGIAPLTDPPKYQAATTAAGALVNGVKAIIGVSFSAGVLRVHINGVLAATSTTDTSATVSNTTGLFIGRHPGPEDHFPGVIDEVQIYNKALSAERFLAHYNASLSSTGPSPVTGIVTNVGDGFVRVDFADSPASEGVVGYRRYPMVGGVRGAPVDFVPSEFTDSGADGPPPPPPPPPPLPPLTAPGQITITLQSGTTAPPASVVELPAGGATNPAAPFTDAMHLEEITFLGEQAKALDTKLSASQYVHQTTAATSSLPSGVARGDYHPIRTFEHWTAGFWPSLLWSQYEHTREVDWKTRAETSQAAIEAAKTDTGTHDMGRLMQSFGRSFDLTGNTTHRAIARAGADSFSARFNSAVGCVRSWDWYGNFSTEFVTAIDIAFNLELLWWAARNGGSATLASRALSSAQKMRDNHVRPDGGSYHLVIYNPSTGALIADRPRRTSQGYSDSSTWARGQAWGITGFVTAYKETGDTSFRDTARAMADYFLNNTTAPAIVAPWDFQAPDGYTYRDSSASAVVADALLRFAKLETSTANATKWRAAAYKILASLAGSSYSAKGTTFDSVLLHGTRHRPDNDQDQGLIYGDSFYSQAILELLSPPRGLTLTAATGRVDLAWQANNEPNLTGYEVYRASSATSVVKLTPSPITTLTYADTNLPSGSYSWFVRAVDSTGARSPASRVVSLASSGYSLNWPDNPAGEKVERYEVGHSITTSTSGKPVIGEPIGSSFTHGEVSIAGKHFYQVRAVRFNGGVREVGPWSGEAAIDGGGGTGGGTGTGTGTGTGGGVAGAVAIGDPAGRGWGAWDGLEGVSGRHTIVSDPLGQRGGKFYRFDLRDGERKPGGSTSSERCEARGLLLNGSQSRHLSKHGTTWFYGWSHMFPVMPYSGSWGPVVIQWHDVADNGHSPVIAWHMEDHYALHVGPQSSSYSRDNVWVGPSHAASMNVWHDIVMKVYWHDVKTQGYIELWRNGVVQTFINGKTRFYVETLYGASAGEEQYIKAGVYRGAGISGQAIEYLGPIRVGKSYEEVVPR